MKSFVVLLCLLAGAAGAGQWSEPVMLADSALWWSSGPVLVPARADTVWLVWVGSLPDHHACVAARMFAGDSWTVKERVTPDSSWYQCPDGIQDEEGRVLVSYYHGSYPVSGPGPGDIEDWGIYTVTRTDTGWTEPELAHEMGWDYGFPFDVRLGRDRHGGPGMVWEEGPGGIHGFGSVMFSRRVGGVWTERNCLARGSQHVSFGGASLIPGDTTDFHLAFSRWLTEPPWTCSLQVWTADDSLVSGPTRFSGSGLLARTRDRRHLAIRLGDSLFASLNRGQGWEPPVLVADRVHRYYSLAADSLGFAWLVWTDSLGQAVMASYHAGNFWTRPETVALGQGLSHVRVAADQDGRAHCSWLAPGTADLPAVYWSSRQTMPGVEETMSDERGTMNLGPTIVHGRLNLPRMTNDQFPMTMLDASGRKVMELQPGENDVRHLAPGVYFVRAQGSRIQGSKASSAKVVIQR